MRRNITLLVLSLPLALVCGCDDDSPPVDERHEGTLEMGDDVFADDGSFYDAYAFRAKSGDRITVTMRSGDVDSFVHIFDEDGHQLAFNDDITPGNLDAQLIFEATSDAPYTVWANTQDGGQTGAYVLTIQAQRPGTN